MHGALARDGNVICFPQTSTSSLLIAHFPSCQISWLHDAGSGGGDSIVSGITSPIKNRPFPDYPAERAIIVGEGNWVDLLVREAIARKLIEVGLEEASRVVKQDGRLTFRYRLIKGHAHIEETDKFGQLKFSNNADNPIYRRWLGQFVIPLGVELDITVEDQQVRASLTACAVTLLAHVVNRYLLL